MDLNLIDRIVRSENLFWAWQKVRNHLRRDDTWHNPLDLAEFELDLRSNLDKIGSDLLHGKYTSHPIRPLPHPKRPNDNGEMRIRQMFAIPIRDQIAWVALVNVIGPFLDSQMPPWSYGNRLYRSAWFEEGGTRPVLRIGPYRHSTGSLYRPFRRSWPVYRRHALLAIRALMRSSARDRLELTQVEQETLAQQGDVRESDRVQSLRPEYWGHGSDTAFAATIDLEKFYPNLKSSFVASAIITHLPSSVGGELLRPLLDSLLRFQLDLTGWRDDELRQIDLRPGQKRLKCIPTGLAVSGFLANVAMLSVDRRVNDRVPHLPVAHSRYVDDHIMIAKDFDVLVQWLKEYEGILDAELPRVKVNHKKSDPPELSKYLIETSRRSRMTPEKREKRLIRMHSEAHIASQVDPLHPTPFRTKLLEKVSNLANVDFYFQTAEQSKSTLLDLEHMLMTEFPGGELPPETRISFAATVLATMTANLLPTVGSDLTESQVVERQQNGGEVDRKAQLQRTYDLLQQAITRYPEKLRLSQRLVSYCLRTGFDGLAAHIELVSGFSAKHELSGRYAVSAVLLAIARCNLQACRMLEDRGLMLPRDIRAVGGYLRSVGAAIQKCQPAEPRFEFEEVSLSLVCVSSLLCSRQILSMPRLIPSVHRAAEDLEQLSAAACRLSPDTSEIEIIKSQGVSVEAFIYWYEESISSLTGTVPSQLWLESANHLAAKGDSAWSVLGRYPRSLPDSAFETLIRSPTCWKRMGEGWLYEAIRAKRGGHVGRETAEDATSIESAEGQSVNRILEERRRDIAGENSSRRILRKVVRAVERKPGLLTLEDWCDWTRNMAAKNAADPRVGEWTGLAIALKIAQAMLEIRPAKDSLDGRISPPNIFVPERLTETPYGEKGGGVRTLTWEVWRRDIEDAHVEFAPERSRIGDGRYWDSTHRPAEDPSRLRVESCARILLGLLRRSFNWPASWNLEGHQRPWGSLARILIARRAISSWSAAILHGCLLPRVRETSLLDFFQPEAMVARSDDTTIDPPLIRTVGDFVAFATKAMEVLERHQMTAARHQPRQLIPISAEQLSAADFMARNEGEDDRFE